MGKKKTGGKYIRKRDLMQMIIEGTQIQNPKEMAHHILEQVLKCSGEIPLDDMTVLVIGIWSLEK